MLALSGSRGIAVICVAVAVLLAALATVEYRWSARVAAADFEREKEHLDSSAALLASDFNATAGQAMAFLETNAWTAFESHARLTAIPKLIAELDYLDFAAPGGPQAQRLASDGHFAAVPVPAWIAIKRCAEVAIEQPPALVAPVRDPAGGENGAPGNRIVQRFRWRSDRCFVARLDLGYLRGELFPQLIRRSFGDVAAEEYDFAVVPFYGAPMHPDLSKRFFSLSGNVGRAKSPAASPLQAMVFTQHVENFVVRSEGVASLFGDGIWRLDIAHKGMPLATFFARARRRDWLLGLAVELLVAAAIAALVIATRRMQKLANQKMQFIAGVSHEMRTPVSAIAMLSRNQADGLVKSDDKVKQYGELIQQQARKLNQMVEQTLEYAAIHSHLKPPAKTMIDVRDLVDETAAEWRDELARSGFDLEVAPGPDLPPVPGDHKLLRVALDNLFSNAQKHAASGRWIRVSAGYSAPAKEVYISVEDRGAGIDASDRDGIFDPFCRGRGALEAQIPGSGLGLTLVRGAAEAHHGRVTLASGRGQGSTFTLHLPA